MLTTGLNNIQQVRFKKLVSQIKGKLTNNDIKSLANMLQCTTGTIRNFLPDDRQEPDTTSDVNSFKNKHVKQVIADKDAEIDVLVDVLKNANDTISEMQVAQKNKNFTAKQLWDGYAEAVGGKTSDDKPLPEYSKLGTQQKGWIAITKLVNK